MDEMLRVAIVDDEEKARKTLAAFLERYSESTAKQFAIVCYHSATQFLEEFHSNFDLILMDIELPGIDGMEVTARIRREDKQVIVIFVTNMAQYAVKGYKVDALDFIVKPVSYPNFSMAMDRAIERYRLVKGKEIWIHENGNCRRLRTSEIKYVEVRQHSIIYATTSGDVRSYDTLKSVTATLVGEPFCLCNRCYLVNLRFVTAVRGFTAVVGGVELQISRNRRQEFLRALNDYLGGDW